MIELSLHPDASKRFDEKGDALLLELKPIQMPSSPKRDFNPGIYVKDTITGKDIIGDIKMSHMDVSGNVTARSFFYNSKEIGLAGESFQQLMELAEAIQKTRTIRQYISLSFLADSIFAWAEKKYKGEDKSDLSQYIINECQTSIHEFEIWIPVALLHIQSDFTIGKIQLKTLGASYFDQWKEQVKQHEQAPALLEKIEKEREKLQGNAIASFKIISEHSFAVDQAFTETEKALSILRFFSTANFFSERRSYCTVLGKENLRSTHYYVFKENAFYPSITSSSIEKDASRWVIDDNWLEMMKESQLFVLSQLITKEELSDFEDKMLTSVLLYSKASLCTEPADKLLYVLTSLESLLLKNETEPIQQNMADRIAFVLAKHLQKTA